jgi:hypothetical protein
MAKPDKTQALAKIVFLESLLKDLCYNLPETYNYLVSELDHQKRIAAELEVAEVFAIIENQ